MFIYLLPFCVAVFIFAAPPHDCSMLLSRGNFTIAEEESDQYFYTNDDEIKNTVIAYDFTSLFPTLTSDVKILISVGWLLNVIIKKYKCFIISS